MLEVAIKLELYQDANFARSAGLRGRLPDDIKLPPSVTVPFSSFEEALKTSANKDIARRLDKAIKDIPATHAENQLATVRDIVMEVSFLPCTARL